MNLIGGPLDGAQSEVIQELTLKKRQSKKSTMSERQLAARQQLARELMCERKPSSLDSELTMDTLNSSLSQQSFISCSSSLADLPYQQQHHHQVTTSPTNSNNTNNNNSNNNNMNHNNDIISHFSLIHKSSFSSSQSQKAEPLVLSSPAKAHRADSSLSACTVSCYSADGDDLVEVGSSTTSISMAGTAPTPALVRVRQLTQQSLGSTSTSSCCSFTRSDSSYSGSSSSTNESGSIANYITLEEEEESQHPHLIGGSDEEQQHHYQQQKQKQLERAHAKQLLARKKEANIKFNKIRLDHLNDELERRLHQYEYLVEQEKALLGSYNMVLFTNEGVNNFHLHEPTGGELSNSSSAASLLATQRHNNKQEMRRAKSFTAFPPNVILEKTNNTVETT